MKTILLTGAGGNAAQNFIACLRMAGDCRIIGVDISPYHLATSDVDKRYVIPTCADESYIPTLLEIIEQESVDLVHAQPDVEVEVISAHRDMMPTFLPPHESIVLCHDKMETNRRLAERGIPHPRAFLVEKVDDIAGILSQLRTETAWLRAVRGAGSRAALPVKTKRQAEEWIHYWRANRKLESKDFMLSEFLPGKEYAFQSLWHRGRLITSAARERMEYMFGNLMPSGQSSSPSVARSVHNPRVNVVATEAIRAVSDVPHGVYCVDMKEDAEGAPCVTEINIGRFFTTSNFFARAGSNMPAMYVALAMGEKIQQQPIYNAVGENLYWIRGVDRKPSLLTEAQWAIEKRSCVSEPCTTTTGGSTATSPRTA